MKLNRTLTTKECHWLPRDLPVGTTIYPYTKPTYGCISRTGEAVSLTGENQDPFIEVPADAIEC
jgi:hypothetical protein